MKSLFLTAAEETAGVSEWLNALTRLNLQTILSAAVIFLVGYALIKWVCKLADKLGLPTTSIITLLGTFGLAFSLAMQNSLSNLAGGLFILGSKPFETGHYISVPGAEGTVSQIGLIHTVLTTVDNKQIHVPNSTVTGSIVTNFSQCATRRIDLTIPVSYDCSLTQAKQVIDRVVGRDSRVLQQPEPPFIRVWNLGASSVDIMVRVWCDGADYWELRSWLLENIKNELDQEGVVIPYSQLDVHLIDKK